MMTYEVPKFVYPITDHRTSKEKIFEYLQAFPMSTTVDIGRSLDMSVQYVGMILVRLHNSGMVVREKIPGQRRILWDAVGENDDRLCKPSRATVTEWKPDYARCPLVAALFGPAQVAA
jgi:hypothetical protein